MSSFVALGVGAETLELSSLPPVPSLTGCGRQTHRVSKVYDFVEDGTNCFRDSASVLSGGEGGGPSARRSLHSIMDQGMYLLLDFYELNLVDEWSSRPCGA